MNMIIYIVGIAVGALIGGGLGYLSKCSGGG
jgi:hypothetical protein